MTSEASLSEMVPAQSDPIQTIRGLFSNGATCQELTDAIMALPTQALRCQALDVINEEMQK